MSKTMDATRSAVTRSVAGVSPLVLGNCAQLSHLATDDLVKLSKAASCRLLVEGENIFQQGEDAESVYVLLDGRISLERSTPEGRRATHTVQTAYSTFGDVVLLGEPRRRYEATAQQDSLIVELPLGALTKALESNQPQEGVAWRGSIMARLHRLEPQEADTFAWRILDKLSQLTGAAA